MIATDSVANDRPRVAQAVAEWRKFYAMFGVLLGLDERDIPAAASCYDYLLVVPYRFSVEVLQQGGKVLPFSLEGGGRVLDAMFDRNERSSHRRAYAVWVQDSACPDHALQGLSGDELASLRVPSLTLMEYLLFCAMRNYRRQEPVNNSYHTLCAGSRDRHGLLPLVCADPRSGSFEIRRVHASYMSRHVGARRVIA